MIPVSSPAGSPVVRPRRAVGPSEKIPTLNQADIEGDLVLRRRTLLSECRRRGGRGECEEQAQMTAVVVHRLTSGRSVAACYRSAVTPA